MFEQLGRAIAVECRRTRARPQRERHPEVVPGILNAPIVSGVIAAVAQTCDVPQSTLLGHSRGVASVAWARQIAMYLLHCSCGLSLSDVGAVFVRDRTTVAHACRCIEERREDCLFDQHICRLETELRLHHRPPSAREAA